MFNEPLFSFSESRCAERVCVRAACSFRNGVGKAGRRGFSVQTKKRVEHFCCTRFLSYS